MLRMRAVLGVYVLLGRIRGGSGVLRGGYGLSIGAMAGCVLCGIVLSPVVTFSQASTTPAGRCFDYDGAGRLIGVRNETGASSNYGLDAASNRKAVVSGPAGSGTACAGSGVPAPSTTPPTTTSPPPPGLPPPPPLVPGNTPPVARPDAFTTKILGNVTKSVMVLANDTDADGDALEITAATHDPSMVQVTKLALPTSGGKFKYLEIIGISEGTTQVQYTISDGRGGSATSVVNVTVTDTSLN